MEQLFHIYFLTNWTGDVLYIGLTNNLERRLHEHKQKLIKGFSSKYNLNKLVYVETFSFSDEAVRRERQLKNWSRVKKNRLVESINPHWRDLSEVEYEDLSTTLGMTLKGGVL